MSPSYAVALLGAAHLLGDFFPINLPSTATPRLRPLQGRGALIQDGAWRFGSRGSELTLLRKGRREESRRVGDALWGCGWGGGRGPGFHIWAGEKVRDSPTPRNPVEATARGAGRSRP